MTARVCGRGVSRGAPGASGAKRSSIAGSDPKVRALTETIRVVVFIILAILLFGFPLTATMIVLLALLNDAAVLSIAFDRVRASPAPERWEMREVLTVATVLGLVGVTSSLVLLLLADRVLGLDRETLRILLYLKLSVAGHLTVLVARTRGPFWSVPPARALLAAVVGTQIAATAIAATGFLMKPLPWRYAAHVWGYAFVWFLLLDQAKLAAHRLLSDHARPGARLSSASSRAPRS